MPKTLLKSRLHSNRHKPKTKQDLNNPQLYLPPNLQSFDQKILSGKSFIISK